MSKVLHISASPRGEASESLAIAHTFLETYQEIHPGHEVTTFDLWDGSLPAFGPDAAAAKMAVFAGQEPSSEAWAKAVATFERINAADKYVFSVPMWNAGIPYILKQLIDVISQPGMLFSFDPAAGYTGLLRGKKAAVIYTSAVYGEGLAPAFGADFQQPYLENWLQWAGIHDITPIQFRPNLVTATADTDRKLAHEQAREVARKF
ncbi:FMN-dependent NADH-azoreductase [Kibdelosporangium banguiense]|uniref:FMN dependent NADH:quinone oxidoreductase n=1 Tax=Kibdelosporangium banguiense TaxID=1365924 RepID=A0ABS4TCN1_9PSEU|nr:NAD(P)H-dependent oxidoreductase [Kibdelosporangium banguiense]MBP2322187.1 FMN-dependent NADH-azoreductase [Kibdelosporangium banguiense]